MGEITLSNGTVVRTRIVPPYAMRALYKKFPEPDFPYVPVRSAAGGEEKLPALTDSPEWIEYQKLMRNYQSDIREAALGFQLNYGIISWKVGDSEEFADMPSDDWVVDPILQAYGEETLTDPMERRSQFIQFELVPTSEDADKIQIAIGVRSEADSKPVTTEDVKAAAAPFESETPKAVH
jgi:hypothetical protein